MSNVSPQDRVAIEDAVRTLMFRLPAGARITGFREAGARAAEFTVSYGNGETITYRADKS